jgi:hypothetical protein
MLGQFGEAQIPVDRRGRVDTLKVQVERRDPVGHADSPKLKWLGLWGGTIMGRPISQRGRYVKGWRGEAALAKALRKPSERG